MIPMIRLDERLIHGQVAIKWSRYLNVDRIVVVSDEAATSPVVQESLLMAAPPTAKTTIRKLDSAIALLQDPRGKSHRILVIVPTPEALLKVIENVPGIELVNVGNYGRIAPKEAAAPRRSFRANLYAYDSEVEVLKKVIATGVKCNYQTIPDDAPEALAKVLK